MNLKIKLIDPSLPIPSYQTKGSVAFDLYSRERVIIPPNTPKVVPLNVVIQFPKGYFLMLAIRSSVPLKKCLLIANGIGVIDQDYQGDEDEIGVEVVNITTSDVVVHRGERIAQGILVPIAKATKFTVVKQMNKTSRGGFGSTGKK
jgi:dUTP pyrophosphatase